MGDSDNGFEMPDPLPSVETLRQWQVDLWSVETPHALNYLRKSCAITDAVAKAAGLGEHLDRIRIPIFGQDGTMLNCGTVKFQANSRGRRFTTLHGRGTQLYPWPMLEDDASKPIVITMGLLNVLSLRSIGCNAITLTGKASTIRAKNIPKEIFPPDCEIVLVPDRTSAGDTMARALLHGLREIFSDTTVYWVNVPKDNGGVIHRHLAAQPADDRVTAWSRLMEGAQTFEGQEFQHASIFENGGRMFRKSGKEDVPVAPFIGHVAEHGLERQAGVTGGRTYLLDLKHHLGPTLRVRHQQCGVLRDEIANTKGAGPEWNFDKFDSERVFNYVTQKSGLSPLRRDFGWHFGFDGDDFSRFITQRVIFDREGSHVNEEFTMEPESRFLASMDLPHPDSEKAKAGVSLLWRQAYKSHLPWVTGPLLVAAIMAPLRRMLAPTEAPFLMFVRGQTASCKTTRVKVFQSLYGDFWNPQDLLTFKSTPKWLEKFVSLCGDAYVVIDELDYAKMDDREQRDVRRYLQGTAQGGGRERLTRTGDIAESAAVEHAIKVITCEQLPAGDQSLIARSLIVHTPSIEALSPLWKVPHDEAERHRHLLPFALSKWITWAVGNVGHTMDCYAEQFEAAGPRIDDVCRRELGDEWSSGANPNLTRVYSRLKVFTAFYHLFLEWSRQLGAIDLVEFEMLEEEWDTTVLRKLFHTQLEALGEGGVANEMVMVIEAAVASGNAVFTDKNTTEGHTVPLRAKQSATRIGFLQPLEGSLADNPKYRDHAVYFRGVQYAVCLDAGVQELFKGKTTWLRIKNYLVDNQMANYVRTARSRFLVCTKEMAEIVMGALDSHYATREQNLNFHQPETSA